MIKKILIMTIKLYQKGISPLFPGKCRFYPTCSSYMIQAIERYGAAKGLYIGIKRLLKCHPFHPGGYDPLEQIEMEKKFK